MSALKASIQLSSLSLIMGRALSFKSGIFGGIREGRAEITGTLMLRDTSSESLTKTES